MRSTIARLGALALGLTLIGSLAPRDAASAANEPYFIGAVVSESGPGSSLGRPEADSIEMAVNEINKAGGVNGHPLSVQVLDDESNPTTAVNAVRQLLDKHPIAIIGSSLTQTSLAMIPVVQAASIPMISLASSAQVIDPVAEHKWIFKMPITDTHVAMLIQSYLKKHNQTKLGFVYRDDDYGKTGMQHFQQAGGSAFDLVSQDAIAANASDATTQLTHVKSANPQAVVVWTTLPSANVIIKAYRELSLPYPIYYSDGAATGIFLSQAGPALNGAYIASTKINVADLLSNSDPQKKVLQHYIGEFLKQYPKDGAVSIFGGFGYDAVYVIKEALQHAKSSEGAKLRDALEHTTYSGVTGTFRISPSDHNGLSGDSLVLTQVENGKFTIAK
ncbi:MAG TPA: ABC transporter substrate-binding protein [Candidatus Baltobacteraceae bacterium]|nr:ABC transporter substrate-binding protein [Candidatus Baltobacteraceae bacterium]